MSIYNPLQYNNQSFSSRVLDTFKEQEAKKQASLAQMNETLRTEAAQGQLGDLANGILNDALAQASEQGLIGVNQYEIMNKAMPKFYAAKSAVTELNQAYNAELEAAKADKRIRVDANYLAYLNDKYYSEGVDLNSITSHTANAINEGFSLKDNFQFLNKEVVQKELVDSIGDFKLVTNEDTGDGQYFQKTISGKDMVTEAGAKSILQNEAFLGLVLDNLGAESLAEISLADAAAEINNIVQGASKKTEEAGVIRMTPKDAASQSLSNQLTAQKYGFDMTENKRDLEEAYLGEMKNIMKSKKETDPSYTADDALSYMKLQTKADGKTPLYDNTELLKAYNALTGNKVGDLNATEQARADKIEGTKYISTLPMGTADDLLGLNAKTFGNIHIQSVTKDKNTGAYSFQLSNKTIKGNISLLEVEMVNGKPDPTDVKNLKEALVSAGFGAEYLPQMNSIEGVGSKYHQ